MKSRRDGGRFCCAAAVVSMCLIAGVIGLQSLQRRTPATNPSMSTWTILDVGEYVGWRLGLRNAPPDIYIDWIAQQVKSESTILTKAEPEK